MDKKLNRKVERMKFLVNKITPAPWSYTTAEIESPYDSYVARRVLNNTYDSEFIAESRNAMPDILMEIEKLSIENDSLLNEKSEKDLIAKEIFSKISDCYGIDGKQNKKIAEISFLIRKLL